MWNLKNKINKQNFVETDSQIQRTDCWLPDGRGNEGLGEKGQRTKKYKLVVTKQSQGG